MTYPLDDPFPEGPPRADHDMLIERPELGPGCYTRVAAGDVIPQHLRPERPATAAAKRKRR